jgi:hypothetical protein
MKNSPRSNAVVDTLKTRIEFNIGSIPSNGTFPFSGTAVHDDTASLECRGLAADPVEALDIAHGLHSAAHAALQRWGTERQAAPISPELRVEFGSEAESAAVLNGLPGLDAVWPYEVLLGPAMLADLAPREHRGRARSERASRQVVGPALRADAAVGVLQKAGVELSFRRAVGWLPEHGFAFVRFGVWRRDSNEAVALGRETLGALASTLLAEMPVHRKTGITQTGPARRIAQLS